MTLASAIDADSVAELFRTAFDEAPIGMCLVAPDGRLAEVNAAFCRTMGYPPEELTRLKVGEITHPDDRKENLELLRRLVDGSLDRYVIRKTNLRKDGSPVPLRVHVAAVRGERRELLYIVAQVQDLTAEIEAERALREAEEDHRRRLEHLARHDSLTGLPNRRALFERLEPQLQGVARGETGAAILFCDLDNFKAVNDTHGHAVGDELLVAVAQRLQVGRADVETVCRFGGDEFVVLVDGQAEAANAVAARILGIFEAPFLVRDRDFPITVSIGVAFSPPGSREDGHALLRNADTAMYRAKSRGRNCVVPFSEGLRQELLDRVDLERDLRAALVRREFLCHYQPVVDLATRRVFQVEALVRWRHPRQGILPPSAFLAGIDRAGFGTQLGAQVLEMAVAKAGTWQRSGTPVAVAVNLSAAQLGRDLPADVERLLASHAVPSGLLCLEITETALVEARSDAIDVLHRLAGLGVRLAIDDFGTGYSSFAYLRDLPVHEVKLDISFIERLHSDERTARVVAGMIRLAHELGLRVVAEGVEHAAQLETLADLGCDAVQGFLIARPSSEPDVTGG